MVDRDYPHGCSQSEAKGRIVAYLDKAGYAKHVTWNGFGAEASAGPLGALFKATGRITGTVVSICNAKGVFSSVVLKALEKKIKEVFPEA